MADQASENPFDAPAETVIGTAYEVGQDNIAAKVGPFYVDIHNPVFAISALSIVAFVFLTLAFQNQVEPLFTGLRGMPTASLDWFFIASANIFVLFCLFLIVSPWGKTIRNRQNSTDRKSTRLNSSH